MDEEQRRKYLAKTEEIIQRAGWLVQAVGGDASAVGFAYTVGLHAMKLPELLTFSLPPDISVQLLNDVGRHLVMCQLLSMPLHGRVEHENWPMPFFLAPTPGHKAGAYATLAARRSKEEASFLQVVWPDRCGKFPWEDGALEGALALQPCLYEPPGG